MHWLTNNDWHVTNMSYIPITGDSLDKNEEEAQKTTDNMGHEISRIRAFLQNAIDSILVSELNEELLSNGLDEFDRLLNQPRIKYLTEDIYRLMIELSNDNSKERAYSLLKSYLSSIIRLA